MRDCFTSLRNALFLPAFLAAAATVFAGPVCELALTSCEPAALPRTLSVPLQAIDLAPRLPACPDSIQVPAVPPPPSIAILIDQSLSVREYNDDAGVRFTLAGKVLDMVHASLPRAQVGLILFNESLVFDPRDNRYFKAPFPADPERAFDAMVPLTVLDRVFPDGRRGVDTLKAFLRTQSGVPVHQTRRRDGALTDFSLAFRAAKAAFTEAMVPPSRQFVVLITDGEHQDIGTETASDSLVKGLGLPTTYTLYLDLQDRGRSPIWIETVVRNIAKNGYGPANPRSRCFAVGMDPPDLGPLLLPEPEDYFKSIHASPKAAALMVSGRPIAVLSADAKEFRFDGRIPLARDTTMVTYSLQYSFQDPGSVGKGTVDTTVVREIRLLRASNAPSTPPGTALICREQARLALYHQGNLLQRVRPRHQMLEVRMTPSKGETCLECRSALRSLAVGDRESLALSPGSGYFSAGIPRASGPAIPGDGTWQNAVMDSLVLIYVNAENPLDSVRVSVPFEDRPSLLEMARHGDIARQIVSSEPPDAMQWLMVGSGKLEVEDPKGGKCCRMVPGPLDPRDSIRYVGVTVSASRAFRFTAWIFSGLGDVVNTVDFKVSDAELAKLPAGPEPGTRLVKILWNNRSAAGDLAGTGPYILRAKAVILRDPDEPVPVTRSISSRFGVLR